jgi:hypothetical protein
MKFNTPVAPISWGELIDKITILEIKQIKITNSTALANIRKELIYLNKIVIENDGVEAVINKNKAQLLNVNIRLWQVEDDIRDKELKLEFDNDFIELARMVYKLNDERGSLKKIINTLLKSELVEEKSYKNFQTNHLP